MRIFWAFYLKAVGSFLQDSYMNFIVTALRSLAASARICSTGLVIVRHFSSIVARRYYSFSVISRWADVSEMHRFPHKFINSIQFLYCLAMHSF